MSRLKRALEKAKEARNSEPEPILPSSTRDSVVSSPQPRVEKEPGPSNGGGVIHVNYHKTKVLKVDPQVLKNNKVVSHFRDHLLTDQIKIFRAQILKKLKEVNGNTLLITSANPGEGKTFTSINLAVGIAQELDRTVILIDADLRHPSIHHYDFANDFFGVQMSQGLSDYLLAQVELPDLLINPGIEKLTILPGGNPLPNSAELLGSRRMASLVQEVKERYGKDRIVIIDSPALLSCADPVLLSRYVDAVLLVVEMERTTAKELKRAIDLLKDSPLAGILVNKAKQ